MWNQGQNQEQKQQQALKKKQSHRETKTEIGQRRHSFYRVPLSWYCSSPSWCIHTYDLIIWAIQDPFTEKVIRKIKSKDGSISPRH